MRCTSGATTSYFSSPQTTIADALKTGRLTLICDAVAAQVPTRDGKATGVSYIDRVTRERKQITRYTAFGAFVRNPAWRPGTEQVVYEYSQVKGNGYLMNLP